MTTKILPLLALLLAACEVTFQPPPPVATTVTVVRPQPPPPPPPPGDLTVTWAFAGTSWTTDDCHLVNAGRMEVVVWDAWDFVAFDSQDLAVPLSCSEGGVSIEGLRPGDYLVEVYGYDRASGAPTFFGDAGLDVLPASETWGEVVLRR